MPIEPVGPVVVGVDGSSTSLDAVEFAAEEATARVTPLMVVHASGGEAPTVSSRVLVDVAVARATAAHPGLAVAGEVLSGESARVLADRAVDASLLVVGHRRRCGLRVVPMGSVAVRVLADARVPVIVHRPVDHSTAVPLPRPVLVGVAAVEGSEPVIEFAFEEAALRGVPLHALHVWTQPDEPADACVDPSAGFEAARGRAERTLAEALAGWSGKYPDVPVQWTVRHSLDVAVVLTAASRSAQLAVIGASQRRGLPQMLAGSVSHALTHRAGCPVAVVGPSHP